jgi:hypothetical protein
MVKAEYIVFLVAAFLIVNTYYDGKLTKLFQTNQKWMKMAMFAFVGLSLFLFLRRNPDNSRQLMVHANDIIKYMPISKGTADMITPFFDMTGVPPPHDGGQTSGASGSAMGRAMSSAMGTTPSLGGGTPGGTPAQPIEQPIEQPIAPPSLGGGTPTVKFNIFSDRNYARYIYIGNTHYATRDELIRNHTIDAQYINEHLTLPHQESVVGYLEQILFKGPRHMKRGSGITKIKIEIL